MIRFGCAAVVLGLWAPAQEAVLRIATQLDAPARAIVAAYLDGGSVPLGSVQFVTAPPSLDIAQFPDADLAFGVGGLTLELLHRADRLVATDSQRAVSAQPFYRSPAADYVVAWARPWVIAFQRPTWRDSTAPKSFDVLLSPLVTGTVVVCDADAAPSLWVAWIQAQAVRGADEDDAFAWLLALDARVGEYRSSPAAARAALLEPARSLAVVPLDEVLSHPEADNGYQLPRPVVPLHGLGLAVLRDSPPARAAYERLLDTELSQRLADEAFLLPSDRIVALAPGLQEARARAQPYRPDLARPLEWVARWGAEVRDRGRDMDALSVVLDSLFAVAFLAFLYFVYSRIRASEVK